MPTDGNGKVIPVLTPRTAESIADGESYTCKMWGTIVRAVATGWDATIVIGVTDDATNRVVLPQGQVEYFYLGKFTMFVADATVNVAEIY